MTDDHGLAMIHLSKRFARSDEGGIQGAIWVTAPREWNLHTHWNEYLKLTDEQILVALTEYHLGRIDEFAAAIDRCDTDFSREMLVLTQQFRDTDDARAWCRSQAERTWELAQRRGHEVDA